MVRSYFDMSTHTKFSLRTLGCLLMNYVLVLDRLYKNNIAVICCIVNLLYNKTTPAQLAIL